MNWLRRIPLTIKVPLLVVAMMIAISAAISERVMSRLAETQERHLGELASAYLDGLAGSLVPHVLRDDIWEVFDTIDRSLALYESVRPVETIVTGRDGIVLAATDPRRVPSLGPLPAAFQALSEGGAEIDETTGHARLRRTIRYQGTEIGDIYTLVDIAPLLAERGRVARMLVATNAVLTLLFAAFGYFAVTRMIAPMRILTRHMAGSAGAPPSPIAPQHMPTEGTEGHRLMTAYNSLVAAERDRTRLAARLATEERLTSLGRLASGMAHEINNPLGGLFNALDTVKRHGDKPAARTRAVALIERGLSGIRDIVTATLETYRPDRASRPFGARDLDDIRLLTEAATRRRQIRAEWCSQLSGDVHLATPFVRQAVLNLVLNAIEASPPGGRIAVTTSASNTALCIAVADSGPGLSAAAERILADAKAVAPIGEPGGLGLWMVRRVVSEAGGTIGCGTGALDGAVVTLTLPIRTTGVRETSDEAA
ncbi:putative sensor histidine kinase [Stappia sp. 22II-S9-Z10]|nr:putative sensor histidine kinase [Stappia sp. 22II-S9-Z10]